MFRPSVLPTRPPRRFRAALSFSPGFFSFAAPEAGWALAPWHSGDDRLNPKVPHTEASEEKD